MRRAVVERPDAGGNEMRLDRARHGGERERSGAKRGRRLTQAPGT